MNKLHISVAFVFIAGLTVHPLRFIQAALIYQDNFEDGNTTAPSGANGLSWQLVKGAASIVDNNGSKVLSLNHDTLLIANQTLSSTEFTLSCDVSIDWSNPARIVVLYVDPSDYYYIGVGQNAGLHEVLGGNDKIVAEDYGAFVRLPHGSFPVGHYKVYVKKEAGAITLKVDRGGDGVDYDLSYVESAAGALALFQSANKFGLGTDATASDVWTLIDNVSVDDSFVQALHAPAALYVDASHGDDQRTYDQAANPATPWKTIQNAANNIFSGDTVIVKPGDYKERVLFNQRHISGSASQKTTFKSDPALGAKMYGFETMYADSLTIDGFDITVITPFPNWTWRDALSIESDYVDAVNNYVHDTPGTCIGVAGVCTADNPHCAKNIYVGNNHTYQCQEGIGTAGNNVLIENNDIERVRQWSPDGDSDYTRFFGSNVTFRGNHLHGNRAEEFTTAHVDGFQTFDNNGEYAQHVIIENNLVEDFYHQGLMGEAGFHHNSFDITFRNNIFKDSRAWVLCISDGLKDVKVYNNLFMTAHLIGVGFGGSTGEVKNNIFLGTNYWADANSSIVASNNLLFNDRAKTVPDAAYKQSDYPNDIVNQDPLFVDPDNMNFHLEAVSPAIDKGAALTGTGLAPDRDGVTRPAGAAWDIGIYEYHGELDGVPQALITFDKDHGYDPLIVRLDGSKSYDTAASIQSYAWAFDDGTSATGTAVTHQFHEGVHVASLTVTASDGKTGTSGKRIQVLHSTYPNLYLYLPFDGNIKDFSGKGMTTSWAGSPSYAPGVSCRAAALNAQAMVNVDNSDDLDGLDQTTLAFWAKKNSADEEVPIIYKHTVYSLSLTKTGFGASIAGITLNSPQGSGNTDWHHYALTWDGATAKLFLDGLQVAAQATTAPMGRGFYWGVAVGADPWGKRFNGSLDEVRLYDRALSGQEIQDLIKTAQANANLCLEDPNSSDNPNGGNAGFITFKNSFNPAKNERLEAKYILSSPGHVTLHVYDRKGEEVSSLVNEDRPAGTNAAIWDGRNQSGSTVASGIYVLQLNAAGKKQTKRVIVVK